MLTKISEWAKRTDNVRVAILTSSRTNPAAPVDVLSDYDIELVVEDLRPFLDGDGWLESFGEVLVRDPYKPIQTDKAVWRLVMYKDAPRVDFHIKLREVLEEDVKAHSLPAFYDIGYEVILDKDGITKGLASPTYSAYRTERPSEIEYQALVNEFWWDATYVAKYLWRDEFFFAKYMLDRGLHFNYLEKVIAWYIGARHNWGINPGIHGRWFKQYLEPEVWAEIESTFAGADLQDNWNALFKTTEVFGHLAAEVGKYMEFAYPIDVERNVRGYLTKIRNLAKETY